MKLFCIILVCTYSLWAAGCPFSDATWQSLAPGARDSTVRATSISKLDESCYLLFVKRQSELGKDPWPAAMEYIKQSSSFPSSLLIQLSRIGKPQANPQAWASICALWERRNARLRDAADDLIASGKPQVADSLFTAFSLGNPLDPYDLVRWAGCKSVLGDYSDAAEIMCKAVGQSPNLAPMAQSQILFMVRDAETGQVHSSLLAYSQCILSKPKADSVGVLTWIAPIYARYGFYDDERNAIIALSKGRDIMPRMLADLAGRHFSNKRFDQAAKAARLAYDKSSGEDFKSLYAAILYQSYDRLGKRDSSLIWLSKASLVSPAQRVQAASLYQNAGVFEKADSLIRILPQTSDRDTLELRSLLFSGRIDSAAIAAGRIAGEHHLANHEIAFWKLRISLYKKDIERTGNLLDSLSYEPGWAYAPEALLYQYYYERLKDDPAAFKDWAGVEYALYRNRIDEIASLITPERYIPRVAQILIFRAATALITQGQLGQANRLLGYIKPDQANPEQMYLCAEVLLKQGDVKSAQALLEQIILTHPRDVFSSRARMLLLKMRS
jgi:tetratricopeptide (TPR) repeat protein